MKRRVPQVQRFAWIFVGNERAITGVDLHDEKVRARMVSEAAWLVGNCGFDGVQWDYEICADGDSNFLKLLRETRACVTESREDFGRDFDVVATWFRRLRMERKLFRAGRGALR